ncbi:MAG: UvrD-helicase domain-containing protein [Bifidobacteriaceae bacterium]|nr:UvrD-helicase domain-containing protein [Bifidobacteriaceae bacterium]
MSKSFENQPIDQSQRDLIQNSSENIFVEAAAGSGKTTQLIARVIQQILQGHSLDQMVIITFTEKAGLELRSRLRKRLQESIDQSSDPTLLQKALTSIDTANIGTIHSFCLALLKRFWVAAKVPPSIRILNRSEEIQSKKLMHRNIINSLENSPATGPFFELLTSLPRLNLNANRLQTVIEQLDRNILTFANFTTDFTDLSKLNSLADQLIQQLQTNLSHLDLTLLQQLPEKQQTAGDTAFKFITNAIQKLEQFQASENELTVKIALINTFDYQYLTGINMGSNIGKAWYAEVQSAFGFPDSQRQNIYGYLDRWSESITDAVFEYLLHYMKTIMQEQIQERIRSGNITNDDLILKTLEFVEGLRRSKSTSAQAILTALEQEYTQILVDEFQDTDPYQVRIFQAILGELTPNKFFVVGDPKQAIYHFRGADLGTYLSLKQAWEKTAGTVVDLQVNFRSDPAILDFVNFVFGNPETGLISNTELDLVQEKYVDLLPAPEFSEPNSSNTNQPKNVNEEYTIQNDGTEAAPANVEKGQHSVTNSPNDDSVDAATSSEDAEVIVLGVKDPEFAGQEKPNIEVLRQMEATDIAETITRWHRESPQEFRFKNIAILVPTAKNIPYLRDALETASIPYLVEVRATIYDTPEVIDALNVLRFLNSPEPQDFVPLILRSTLFGFSDQQLLEYRIKHPRDTWLRPTDEITSDLESAVNYLYDLQSTSQSWAYWQIIEGVYRDCQTFELQAHFANGQATLNNINNFLTDLRVWQEDTQGSLTDYLEYVKSYYQAGSSSHEIVMETEDFDAVTITNFHQSKGREWDIVFVAGANNAPRSEKSEPKIIPTNHFSSIVNSPNSPLQIRNASKIFGPKRVAIRANGHLKTLNFDSAAQVEKLIENAERTRIFYVAFTRARKRLIVTAHYAGKNTFGKVLTETIQTDDDRWQILDYSSTETEPSETESGTSNQKLSQDTGSDANDIVGASAGTGNSQQSVGGGQNGTSVGLSTGTESSQQSVGGKQNSAGLGAGAKAFRAEEFKLKEFLQALEIRKQVVEQKSTLIISQQDERKLTFGQELSAVPQFRGKPKLPADLPKPTNPKLFGTIVHRALQLSELSLDQLDAAIDQAWNETQYLLEQPEQENPFTYSEIEIARKKDRQLVEETCKNVLHHPLINEARNSATKYFELPLLAQNTANNISQSITAYADLVFQDDSGQWVVVDFKNARNLAHFDAYLSQLKAYAKIFQDSTHQPVQKLSLLYCLGKPTSFDFTLDYCVNI